MLVASVLKKQSLSIRSQAFPKPTLVHLLCQPQRDLLPTAVARWSDFRARCLSRRCHGKRAIVHVGSSQQLSEFSRQLAVSPTAFRPQNGGFVPVSGEGRSFIFNQIGGFVFKKSQFSAVSHQLAVLPSAFCLPPTAFCCLPFAFRPPTVASFPIFPRADPLLSIKSVASFFKKVSAFRPSAIRFSRPTHRLLP